MIKDIESSALLESRVNPDIYSSPKKSLFERTFNRQIDLRDRSIAIQLEGLTLMQMLSDGDLSAERRLIAEDAMRFLSNPESWGFGLTRSSVRKNLLIIPGLMGSDIQYFALDPYIERMGHRPQHAGILRNLGFKETIDSVEKNIADTYNETGEVTYVKGHSLGGMVGKAATLRLVERFEKGEFEKMPVGHLIFVASPADNSNLTTNANVENLAYTLQQRDPNGDEGKELLGSLLKPLPDYIPTSAISLVTDFIVKDGSGEANVTPHAVNYSVPRGSHTLFHLNPNTLRIMSQILA